MDMIEAGEPEGALFAVDTEFARRAARLALRGELDVATVGIFDDALCALWSHDVDRVEIDLRDLTFLGSAGVAAILEVNARAREAGCALTLVRGPGPVHRIFELTGIEGQFAFRQAPERPAGGGQLRVVS